MGLKDIFAAHAQQQDAARHVIDVEGMHCNACERLVAEALGERGASNVVASHETGKVEYDGDLSRSDVEEAIRAAGFTLA